MYFSFIRLQFFLWDALSGSHVIIHNPLLINIEHSKKFLALCGALLRFTDPITGDETTEVIERA
ncbi:hypothetical protein [Natrinema limicola]|uniref:Uncharacterized protein n=1 Tax=Natrinema limicola JCM 13563 TaxID=1230457 RepID=M0C062_9EURY|nr:hypothetical protein [Natrinema limicola]ELZ16585.1 hypothetical protein C476_17007 [Natrinema limicola JCM 13563]